MEILTALFALLIGGTVAWLWRGGRAAEALRAESERRATAEERAARVPALEQQLVEQTRTIAGRQAEIAGLETPIETIEPVERTTRRLQTTELVALPDGGQTG